MVVGSFKEILNLIILYQMMYITDWSKYILGCQSVNFGQSYRDIR